MNPDGKAGLSPLRIHGQCHVGGSYISSYSAVANFTKQVSSSGWTKVHVKLPPQAPMDSMSNETYSCYFGFSQEITDPTQFTEGELVAVESSGDFNHTGWEDTASNTPLNGTTTPKTIYQGLDRNPPVSVNGNNPPPRKIVTMGDLSVTAPSTSDPFGDFPSGGSSFSSSSGVKDRRPIALP
ncbi:hypothetical protein GJ629_02530 [Halapricum sp. CBA1109]|uniref:hypothetical protein n=1 Tax=Halapricum sp. CBA1109 TaxID=2668068 RepID=UPI0012F84E6D|nr:hypothetical protein [Halapricum sp. CBA1109]MUV88909.1 hypothetical protein [Halapricum sp. CBA1109]